MKQTIIMALKKTGIFPVLKKMKLWSEGRTRGMMSHYSSFIKNGDVVFDIGANMGSRSEIFLGLGAKVVAVEPQITCGDFLSKHFSGPHFTLVPMAMSDTIGTATLSLCKDASVIATMSEEWRDKGRFSEQFTWSEKIEVPTTTLDALISTYGVPRFCKIDVEGFEEKVIGGLTGKIPNISFEFTREFFETAERITGKLEKLGACEFNYSLGESHNLAHSKWLAKNDLISFLKNEKSGDLWGDIYVRMQ